VVLALEDVVAVPAGSYRLGEPGEERMVELRGVRIGRWPVTNAHAARFVEVTGRSVGPAFGAKLRDERLADHPATDLTLGDAQTFCAWATAELGETVRLPTADEWEALARGDDARPWPWGDTFDPDGAGPFGAEQLAGNVWEWVSDRAADGWGVVRGGSYLDCAWGLRASRALPADPRRATATTGFRIAIDHADADAAHSKRNEGRIHVDAREERP
jgi:formylglycine-generating enzyme required for sulfatase activity